MNHLQYYFLLLLSLVLLSCEKVIDVETKQGANKFVIEGVMTNEVGGCEVKISRSKSIQEDHRFVGVSRAQVHILDENGSAVNITETEPGLYKSNLKGDPGKRYTLQVAINGELFTATAQMAQRIALDSLYVATLQGLDKKEYFANVVYTDPVERGNAYRFVQYINDRKTRDVFVRNDELYNGRKTEITLFSQDDLHNEIKPGDQIRVEMFSIDAPIYAYWYSLGQGATGIATTASPANPISNLSGTALGYFSAHSKSVKTVTVK